MPRRSSSTTQHAGAVEVTCADAKHTTGVGEAENRTRLAVERTVPFGLLMRTLIVVWYHLSGHSPRVVKDHRERARWYTTKTHPSFADMIAKLRRVLIAAELRADLPSDLTPNKSTPSSRPGKTLPHNCETPEMITLSSDCMNKCSRRIIEGMELREIIELVRETLDEPVLSCADADVLEGLRECEALARLALARQLDFVAEAQRRGLAGDNGYRNVKTMLRDVLRISGGDANSRVTVARKVERRMDLGGAPLPADLPATARALREGAIGVEHARAITEGMRKVNGLLCVQEFEHAEAMLAEQARILGPHDVHTVAERLVYHCDQDGALREEERQHEDRELHFGVARDGMTVVKGRLDREAGAKLRAALEPLAAPRPESDGAKDPRTPGQRTADALVSVLDIALSSDGLPRAGGQRPHITVTISVDSLQRRIPFDEPGTAGLIETTGQPMTATQIRRLACDAEVLSGDGQPLDVGRSQRTAPPLCGRRCCLGMACVLSLVAIGRRELQRRTIARIGLTVARRRWRIW